ncbi:MAG: hypothetical protein Q9222_006130 [Ikaeria aurantiellina]
MADLDVTTKVMFRRLRAHDIAAVWRGGNGNIPGVNHDAVTGCSGQLLASRQGPGTWLWLQIAMPTASRYPAEGASYIAIPQNLPPDPKTSRWLASEGVLGLIWGGGRWFASPSAQTFLESKGMVSVQAKFRRDIRSDDMANAYARPPARTMYPTLVDVNGTQYTTSEVGDFFYTSSAGTALNLTDWFMNHKQ